MESGLHALIQVGVLLAEVPQRDANMLGVIAAVGRRELHSEVLQLVAEAGMQVYRIQRQTRES